MTLSRGTETAKTGCGHVPLGQQVVVLAIDLAERDELIADLRAALANERAARNRIAREAADAHDDADTARRKLATVLGDRADDLDAAREELYAARAEIERLKRGATR